ncbi:hypothetical protein [Mycolicibacterium thermoresistibile]
MGKHRRASTRRRPWLPAAAMAVPIAGFLSASAASQPSGDIDPGWNTELIAAAPDGSVTQYRVPAHEPAPPPVPVSRAAHRVDPEALPAGVASERGLQVKTILAARAVSAIFPEIMQIGGVRADSMRWHPNGLAIDVMIPNYATAEGRALGDEIVEFVLANADRFGLDHIIWRQTYYPRNGSPRLMADRGSDNANHYNHVHIATTGGGYPGSETFLR